jgi:exosortase
MSEPKKQNETAQPSVMDEISRLWAGLPDKPLFFALFLTWLVFFHFLGNSTLGYVDTHSLYAWMNYSYSTSKDDELGYIIPLIVLGLCYWKRDALLAVPKHNWWPALVLVTLALAIHLTGYVIQQARVSIVGFYFGIYALPGVVWGPGWLKASFFPCLLFAFGVPVGTMAETVTVPLSHIASDITGWICGTLLGIDIIQEGVQISDSQRRYTYAIAAACSGLRSLIVTLAFFTIYGFVAFTKKWKTSLIILSAFPLAVAGNVLRLTLIILAAEMVETAKPGGGQAAGNFVHDNGILSLLPYIPAFIGVFILGRIIKEDDQSEPEIGPTLSKNEADE